MMGARGNWQSLCGWAAAALRRGRAIAFACRGGDRWTIFYGIAFAMIYARPITRVEASQWIYDNIPARLTLGCGALG